MYNLPYTIKKIKWKMFFSRKAFLEKYLEQQHHYFWQNNKAESKLIRNAILYVLCKMTEVRI